MIVSAFWKSPQRNKIVLLALALVLVVGAAAYAQIWLNAWNRPFYDALARKDFGAFVHQLGVFAAIAGVLLALNVAQLWLNQTGKVSLREGLVHDLLDEWLKPLRAFRLSNAGEIGANPDQRIHEDARHLTELSVDLGIGLLQATLLLFSFVGVLWTLSRSLAVQIGGHSFTLPPGYMVWSALFYAGAASLLSWSVGRPLIELNAARYAREAELRFALVRINEGVGSIAAYEGEADERARVETIFQTVLVASRRIVGAVTRLTWVTAGYGWFTIIAPILVAAPIYFNAEANLSFGELMMIVGAFNQVQQSLRWFVDNFSVIADWRATLIRVSSFRRAILAIDTLGRTEEQIAFEEGGPSFRFEKLCIAAPECCRLEEASVELKPGERVSVVGETGEQHTLLFRTLAGLWPWGSGRVVHPPRRTIIFMSSQAYLPPGTLLAAIAYPHSDRTHDTARIAAAFEALGLERRLDSLDAVDRWDQLGNDERQRLAFVRVILQRPDWLVLDGVLDPLEDETRARVEALFRDELKHMGIISLGDAAAGSLFTRTLHLVANPAGSCFEPVASAHAAASAAKRKAKRSARQAVPAQ
ncbi:ABC transporter ATP-binding protein/permease [Aureimonas leprariae]|uniref:ABC transporter ATP-binding protein/permease n=1 Tax=Plantimonas leprariae TaxID=2615207 RepID=A0A7V7PML0_9HYPH|nr:ABC transporter ATP-binding protein/permease [Aureimonas leprariae]KAB0678489.1 ABC transporter ATP-binding protein/permease [Aureimonas leprariae]